MKLIDTHCHIHDPEFFTAEEAEDAVRATDGIEAMLLVGTSLADSKNAIQFAAANSGICWASIGIHPHEGSLLTTQEIDQQCDELAGLASDERVLAVGECGFDFYYNKRSEVVDKQTRLLERQLEIAKKHDLPVSFHVRDGFDDFWPVYDRYGVRGVLHSFTDTATNLQKGIERGLFIGVNGIATFTKDAAQKELFRTIPLDSVVVETDSPFLTPHPKRGTINVPRNVTYVTSFLAELRGEDVEYINRTTTENARGLFTF